MLELAIATDELRFRDFRKVVIFGGIQNTGTAFVLRCRRQPASFTAESAL
jgi:hypothetical protein